MAGKHTINDGSDSTLLDRINAVANTVNTGESTIDLDPVVYTARAVANYATHYTLTSDEDVLAAVDGTLGIRIEKIIG